MKVNAVIISAISILHNMNYIICFPPNSKKLGDEIICKNVNSYPAGPSSDPSDDTRTFSQFLASFYTKNSVYTK
jgi:hypothetical protein